MPYFTQEIPEGLKFENKEEAFAYFEQTLSDKTPLGDLYERLHNEDWGDFNLQATGLDTKEFNIQLEKHDLEADIYQKINFNTYGNQAEVNYDEVVEVSKKLSKASDFVMMIVQREVGNIIEQIDNKNQQYLTDLFTDFNNLIYRVDIEAELNTKTNVVIVLTDSVSNLQLTALVGFKDELKIEEEEVEKAIHSMFMNKLEGQFDGETFTIDGYPLSYILNYAVNNPDTKLHVELNK